MAKVANSPSIYPRELRMSRTSSTMLFSLMSITCNTFGLRLNSSPTTAEPIEPAPPITRKREEDTIAESSFSWLATSLEKRGEVRPIRFSVFFIFIPLHCWVYLQGDLQYILQLAFLYVGNAHMGVMCGAFSMPGVFEHHCRLNIQGIHHVVSCLQT